MAQKPFLKFEGSVLGAQTGRPVFRGRMLSRMAWPTRYMRRMHHAQVEREKIEEEERE